ncbi:hypothetical protein Pla86_52620 (plasmid) [Planctomycetes bacterium Pla86]|nr:hypothetical protein Pla86_52620 [Planctomycetes bacterium Pla86]
MASLLTGTMCPGNRAAASSNKERHEDRANPVERGGASASDYPEPVSSAIVEDDALHVPGHHMKAVTQGCRRGQRVDHG